MGFNDFNIYFKNNENKFVSLACGLHDNIAVTKKKTLSWDVNVLMMVLRGVILLFYSIIK